MRKHVFPHYCPMCHVDWQAQPHTDTCPHASPENKRQNAARRALAKYERTLRRLRRRIFDYEGEQEMRADALLHRLAEKVVSLRRIAYPRADTSATAAIHGW